MITPGVYIEEPNPYTGPVNPVSTAVPAFIGFTQKVAHQNAPCKITSMQEYREIFGGAPETIFDIIVAEDGTSGDFSIDGKSYNLSPRTGTLYYVYNSVRLFFANGGGECYIVSVGTYGEQVTTKTLLEGINQLEGIPGVTLLTCPDALLLEDVKLYCQIANAMLAQCNTTKDRVAILDIYKGSQSLTGGANVHLDGFRKGIDLANRTYAAAYYPFVQSSIIKENEFDYRNIGNRELLDNLLTHDIKTKIVDLEKKSGDAQGVNTYLRNTSPLFNTIFNSMGILLNTLPTCGAIAGVYATVDEARGVWKAPANISPTEVVSPAVPVNDDQQQELANDYDSGVSINTIRSFTGYGTLVWGARTMDGNSQDFRYIHIRRTCIFVEQSVIQYIRRYTSAPNTPATWRLVQEDINTFLTELWKQGAFAGSNAKNALNVQVGLGATMSAQDILDGYMVVSIQIAVARPAEFIIISIRQQMQRADS